MRLTYFIFLFLINIASNAQIITTVAGTGPYGYSGDGGPATNAKLSDMYYCTPAFDKAGNIYVAQSGHNTIRKIDKARSNYNNCRFSWRIGIYR